MDYTGLLTKAWNTVWNNKFLMVFGLLAAFGQATRGGANVYSGNSGGSGGQPGNFPPDFERFFDRGFGELTPAVTAAIVAAACLACVILICIVLVNRIAQGGLINGVNTIDGGGTSGFFSALRAGWSKLLTLVLIWLVAAIPSILMVLVLGAMGFGYLSSGQGELLRDALAGGNFDRSIRALFTNGGFVLGILAVFCPLFFISLIMQAIALFADRACVVEGKGLVDAYQRGFQVLRDHLGNAVGVYLLQVILLGVAQFALATPILCCFAWPITGVIESYFSTVWTLAWRQWTGTVPAAASEPPSSAPSPSV